MMVLLSNTPCVRANAWVAISWQLSLSRCYVKANPVQELMCGQLLYGNCSCECAVACEKKWGQIVFTRNCCSSATVRAMRANSLGICSTLSVWRCSAVRTHLVWFLDCGELALHFAGENYISFFLWGFFFFSSRDFWGFFSLRTLYERVVNNAHQRSYNSYEIYSQIDTIGFYLRAISSPFFFFLQRN